MAKFRKLNHRKKVFNGDISKITMRCIGITIHQPNGNEISILINGTQKVEYSKNGVLEFKESLIYLEQN